MAIKKAHFSFLKGMNQVKLEDKSEIQQKLYDFMGCSSWPEFYRKRKEYVNLPVQVQLGIDNIFAEYGISHDDIWTITDDEGKEFNL
jgi:hypothetical protein